MNERDDWRPGDLALCIKRGEWRYSRTKRICSGPRSGEIHAVRRVGVAPESKTLTLWLVGYPGELFMDGFSSRRFIKVAPREADEYDRETIALLTGNPVKEEA